MIAKEKMVRRLNEAFRVRLTTNFRARFGIDTQNDWDLLSGHLITTRTDGEDFTPEQHAWIAAWVNGWETCAMESVR